MEFWRCSLFQTQWWQTLCSTIVSDPVVTDIVQALFKELASNEACMGPLQHRLLPTLVSILQAEPGKVALGLPPVSVTHYYRQLVFHWGNFVSFNNWHIDNKLYGLGQLEDLIFCVLLVTHTCNVWGYMLFHICLSIQRHSKHSVDTLIIRKSEKYLEMAFLVTQLSFTILLLPDLIIKG